MNYYLKRTGQALFTIFLAITLTFILIRLMPGGPMDYMKARFISQQGGSVTQAELERINALVETYVNVNPDEPMWAQYIDFVSSTVQGDLGRSIWFNSPVADLIADRLPWTLFLMSFSIVWTFGTGIVIGAILAYREGSRFDITVSSGVVLLHAIPYYIVGVLLVYFLGYQLGWFPIAGRSTPGTTAGFNYPFVAGVFYHAALPMFSIVITGLGGRAIGMRGNAVRVLGEDYLRVARLRGLKERRIALHYVGRNALLPLYTNFMMAIGFMFGGAVILEQIFNYRGVGQLLFQSIGARDYPLMMGCFLIITVAVIFGIYVADLTYGKLDPRVSAGGEGRESY